MYSKDKNKFTSVPAAATQEDGNDKGGGGGDGDDDDDDDDIAFLQKSPNLPSAKSSLGSNIVLAKRWDQETSKSLQGQGRRRRCL